MKEGINRFITGMVKGIFFAVLSVQTMFALIWGYYNITDFKRFTETEQVYEILAASRSLLPMLYIVKIILCGAMLFFAFNAFLKACGGKKVPFKYPALLTGLVITSPFVWPLLFTALRDIPALALSLLVLGYAFLFLRNVEREKAWRFLTNALCGAVILCVYSKPLFCVVLVLLVLIFLLAVRKATKIGGDMGISVLFALFGIMLLVILFFAYLFISIRKGVLDNNGNLPGITYLFFGKRANGLVFTTTGEWLLFLKDTGKEWFGAMLSPWILSAKVYPLGDSVNPFTFNILWQECPTVTEYYISSCRVGGAVLASAFVLKGIWNFITGSGRKKRRELNIWVFLLIAAAVASGIVLLFTHPEFDFRNALWAYVIWMAWGFWQMTDLSVGRVQKISEEKPESPDSPENPESADSPENPETEEMPENPGAAENTENPETTDSSEKPESAESTENKETEENPEITE